MGLMTWSDRTPSSCQTGEVAPSVLHLRGLSVTTSIVVIVTVQLSSASWMLPACCLVDALVVCIHYYR